MKNAEYLRLAYQEAFDDELRKLAADDEKKKKKFMRAEVIAPAAVGAGAFGMGYIDRRKKIPKFEDIKHLGDDFESVKQHLRVGDVMIGAEVGADDALANEAKAFKEKYTDIRSSGKNPIAAALKTPKINNLGSVSSKLNHPFYSHTEVVTSPTHASFLGGEKPVPISNIINKSEKATSPHFVVVRPNRSDASLLAAAAKRGDQKYIDDFTKRVSVGLDKYDKKGAPLAAVKDWLFPKFRSQERAKTPAELAFDKACDKGTCATTGALSSKRTIGGKLTQNVLPIDYLRSNDYDIVGRIGGAKTSTKSKIIMNVPKYFAKSVFAGGAAAATYGAVKGVKAFMNKRKQSADMKKFQTPQIITR